MSDPPRAWNPDRSWYRYALPLIPAEGGRWLDLGCGGGELLELAATAGRGHGIGLERHREAARLCRRHGGHVLVADLSRPLPIATDAIDGATLVEVIEHVLSAEAFVAELARVIRPGGWLVLTTPNVAHWSQRVRSLTGHAPKQEGRHVRFFVRDELEALLADAGFRLRARASFGKQALATKLARWSGRIGAGEKVRYRVPTALEPLLAQHFVWRLERER